MSNGQMHLFSDGDASRNLLPCDGEAIYFGRILDPYTAWKYHDEFLAKIPWRHDETVMYGKHIVVKREIAWYSEFGQSYNYSGATREALVWSNELLALRTLVERLTKTRFNSCLFNLYHSGEEGISWHSDSETSLGKNPTIASLSFGAERKFFLKHKWKPHKLSVVLEHGGLLVMRGNMQNHWLHSLPKSKRVLTPRINLTFRNMVSD